MYINEDTFPFLIDDLGANGELVDLSGDITLTTEDLEHKKLMLLSWLRNLATLKLYNAFDVFFFAVCLAQ